MPVRTKYHRRRDTSFRQGILPTRPECPYCGTVVAGWTDPNTGDRSPKGGDVAICLHCGEPALYTTGLGFRKPNVLEMADIEANPDFQAARRNVQSFIANNPEFRRDK